MKATATSQTGTLNYRDLVKGLITAVLAAVVGAIYSGITEGGIASIHWPTIGSYALVAGVGYLVKNFISPSQIVIEDPHKTTVKAVKEGTAEVKVLHK